MDGRQTRELDGCSQKHGQHFMGGVHIDFFGKALSLDLNVGQKRGFHTPVSAAG
jgi:hypothetical protein